MVRRIGVLFTLVVLAGLAGRASQAQDANAILDRAIQALGGAEKLEKVKAASWTSTGTLSFNGADNPMTTRTTAQGLNRYRQEFEGEIGGNKIQGLVVLNGDKAWRLVGGNQTELDAAGVANMKRALYLAALPIVVWPLKAKEYKLEPVAEEKVGEKPAVGLKVTPPDGKEFRIYFDKESGLPVRTVARVVGFQGEEYTQETTFSGYKEVGGIQKAGHVESKRDGEKFIVQEVSEFKVLDQVDAKTFSAPQ